MHEGKYQRAAAGKHHRKRLNVLIISLVVLLVAVIGRTVAYLIDSTNQVTNTFTPAKVEIKPTEDTTDNSKSDIKFQNTGNVPAYIRASLAIYWKDEDENIVPKPNGGRVILGELNEKWTIGADGIYYYTEKVDPGSWTEELMGAIQVEVPKGYTCHIDVLSEAIQADGMDAGSAIDAWDLAND